MDRVKLIVAILILLGSIAAYYFFSDFQQVLRVLMVVAGVIAAGLLALTTEPGQATWAFAKGANIERQKVVWPTRREAMQVTLFVIILVIIIGIYLWFLDWVSFQVIYDFILNVAS
ncbi:MAG: preprotein translocase subunit SecE [Pseudomonadota bacterium]